MTSYSTLQSGDKFFPYKEHLNAVHPDHADAQFFIPKHNSHTSISKWTRNFWKNDVIEDNFPYTLGEDSLRLYQLSIFENLNEDLQFEALIFNFHKVYPPGDKSSPELSEKGLMGFDEKFVQKVRRLIKYNSMAVRDAFGISVQISPVLLKLHKQLQSNVLFYLQHKTDSELDLMNLPAHSEVYELLDVDDSLFRKKVETANLYPTDENAVRRCWWNEFKRLKGGQRYEKYGQEKYNLVMQKNRQFQDE